MLSNRQTQRDPIEQTWAAGLDAFNPDAHIHLDTDAHMLSRLGTGYP
jgi:hypothetical protein